MARRARVGVRPVLDIPDALTAIALDPGCEEFVLLSWPLRQAAVGASELTPAETAVAELAFAGLANEEIARARGRSARTVANQLASAYRKLGVGSRAELAARLASVAGRTPRSLPTPGDAE
jgi:DNA-binding NarL/FixJ family response regulator